MKITHIAATALAASSLLVPTPQAFAQAAEEPEELARQVLTVDESGNPTSGMVTLDLESATPGGVSTRKIPGLPGSTTEDAGGGTWTYGWELVNGTTKRCFSNYNHPTNSHRASVSMGSMTDSKTARPTSWAKASVVAGVTSGTCNVFWDNR
ncbi:lactococcin 972 family bacteriocin [Corynebacterium tapiri]|uniref:Lactococcin 972 family bacteriocin n=1 Tax=Corynebacterium tapiri TaxID=1448266 RepID=A0A5C4U2C1_9CORY|nr:lactococcin 972 family bacteriocin [Corynebacterium tapiri]